MSTGQLRVLVVTGGPDREYDVSLQSAQQVTEALRQAGHLVRQALVGPDDLSALDHFVEWEGNVIFPALHGPWGEGGQLQQEMERRDLPFVGSGSVSSALCMDKHRAKAVLIQHHLDCPPHQLLDAHQAVRFDPPVVIKPPCEGSSIDLEICTNGDQLRQARGRLHQHHVTLMVEKYVAGKELTVAVLQTNCGPQALPAIHVVPATGFYDYAAKYQRDDTAYLFDINLPAHVLERVDDMALAAHEALGCRHLSRVDLIVDPDHQPWILEVNTIPGFTSHSLVPMAAARRGMSLSQLTDRLVRLAIQPRYDYAANVTSLTDELTT